MLVVTLEKRMAYFKDLMAFPVFFPQQEKSVQEVRDGIQVYGLQRAICSKGLDRL